MTNQIHCEVFGNLGVITLNRPKALNALTTEMCAAMTKIMLAWQDDSRIGAVLVRGEGERAFCAGGDVVMLHDSGKAGDGRAEKFWRTEYALNDLIHRYAKPYIAMIDGIVMGGGVGLSVHGRLRIAGDNTLFAMPETGIGYFPDVGGTYFLPRLGRAVGNWLGLTGARLKTAQACALGVANGYIPSGEHAAAIKALGQAKLDGSDAAVLDVLAGFITPPPKADPIPETVRVFEGEDMSAIVQALGHSKDEWAQKQLAFLHGKSPLALCVTLEALTRGAAMDFRAAMQSELSLSLNFLKTQDFYEGIRAQLIDKDRNPKWSADSVSGITSGQVERMFSAAQPPLAFLN